MIVIMHSSFFTVVAMSSIATAQFCGVVTSPIKSYQNCAVDQFPAMDAACTAVGGTVAGHNQESGDQRSNCITYCNDVPSGGHETRGTTTEYHEAWHLYIVDACDSCEYCGPAGK